MQQIQCSRCGYTLAGMPGSAVACPNCGQQSMIPGGSSQGWGAYPGAQPTYGAPQQPSNPYGAPPAEQQGYGSGPSYGQQATPYPPQQPGYPPPSGAYGAYGPAQPGGYPGGYAPPATMAPPAPARRNPLLPIALVVVLLLVAGGAFLFIKNNKSSGGNVPSGYTTYTDTNGLFTIGYPSGWSKTNQTVSTVGEVLFQSPDHTNAFVVAVVPAAGVTTSDIAPLLDSFFTVTAQSMPGGGTVGNTTSPQNVTIAGQTWTEEAGDINYTDPSTGNSGTAHSEVAAVVNNGHAYIVAYATQDGSKFDAAKQQYFTPMLNSFAFK